MISVNRNIWINAWIFTAAALLAALGWSGPSWAFDFKAGVETLAIGSDNIDRGPPDEATDGYLLTLNAEMAVIHNWGAASVALSLSGGYEFKMALVDQESSNYFGGFVGKVPWARTGYVEGSLSASEGTAEPDLTDISQVRVRTRTSKTGLALGGKPSPVKEWRVAVISRTEDRFDRDLDESILELDYKTGLDARRTLTVEADTRSGTEKIEDDDWTGFIAKLDYQKKASPTAAGGYRLIWENQELKQSDGTSDNSDKTTALVYYETGLPSGWTVFSALGFDRLNLPGDGKTRYEPNADISVTSPPQRRFRLLANVTTNSSIQDPVDDEVAWTRNSQARIAVQYSATRKIIVEPSLRHLLAELTGNNIVDRTDETLIWGIETTWTPYKLWSINLNGFAEDRTSSDSTYDLSENRIELRVSGTFD